MLAEPPTVKNRILLHLLDHTRFTEAFDVPLAMSQEGIAEAVWIDVRHVVQYVRPLIEEDLVLERMAHIRGRPRKRKVYDLTDGGRVVAYNLRERLKLETVRVRRTDGVREVSLGEVLRDAGDKASLVSILRECFHVGAFDLRRLEVAAVPSQVEMLSDAPALEDFVGREEELALLTHDENRPRVFVIRGVAGIGKSTLAAKVCELLRGSRHLFWYRVRAWDTPDSVLAAISIFLTALGRPALKAALAKGQAGQASQVLREDLPGLEATLILDDAHEAKADLVPFLRFLKDAVVESPEVRLLVLTRRRFPFYDRRDVVLEGNVAELDLRELEADEVEPLLPEPLRTDVSVDLARHPLFLKLLRFAPDRAARGEVLRDIHRFIEEEIYRDLSDPERTAMKTASLYEIPVPREVLFSTPSTSHDVLFSLQNRALLRRVGGDSYEVHDTIRSFFTQILSPGERESLGATAAEQLRKLAVRAYQTGDLVLCINCLSNARELLPPGVDDPSLSELLGDSYDRIGDLPAALNAYRQALRSFDEAEALARVHRKMAFALEDRGDITSARAEVEAGFNALGEAQSAERGWLDLSRCRVAYRLADWEQALEAGESALETLQTFDAPAGEARTLLVLGHIAMHSPQNDPAQAKLYLTQALELSASIDDTEFAADVRIALAHLLAWHLRDLRGAILHAMALEEHQAALNLPRVRQKMLLFHGMFRLIFFADYEAAQASFRLALDEARKIHDQATVANAKVGLGYAAYFQGRFAEARRCYEEAAGGLKAQGLLVDTVNILLAVSEASLLAGDQPAAAQALFTLMSDSSLSPAVDTRGFYVRLTEGYTRLIQGDRQGAYAALADAVRRAVAKPGIGEGTMTYDFVACISWPAVYALLYSGVALRFLGRQETGDAQIAKAREIVQTHDAKAWLDGVSKVERRLTDVLRDLLEEPS